MHGTQVVQAQHTFSQIAGNTYRDKALGPDESRGGAAARRSRATRQSSTSRSPPSTLQQHQHHRPAQSTSLAEVASKQPTAQAGTKTPTTPSIVVHSAQKEDYFTLAAAVNDETTSVKRRSSTTSNKLSHDGKKRADGTDKTGQRASRGTMPIVASSSMANMANALPPRPPLVSHTSNSVPSTPHQHAREFMSRSRSPSPHQHLAGSHSPSSVKSEVTGYMAALPRGRPTCKYETAAAFGRRRIQYDIGDAILERPKEEPKAFLNPEEEDKLSGDMRELYDRLLPSEESEQRRKELVTKLDRILRNEWPGTEFTVHVFGSSGNLLCTSESDGEFTQGLWS